MALLVREFVVALPDRPGALADLTSGLGRAGVNMAGFAATARGGPSELRFVPTDPAKAEAWLQGQRWRWSRREAIALPGVDEPGFVGGAAERLAAAGVNIEAAYPTLVGGEAHVLFSVDDPKVASKALA